MSSSRFCCVPSCNNFESSSSDCWFYEFPDDEALFETWMKQCGLQSASTGVRDYSQMICSAHFDGYSFRSGKLSLFAMQFCYKLLRFLVFLS